MAGNRTRMPAYLAVKRQIEGMIDRGVLRSGALLPGERELAAKLGVTRGTVSHAIKRLVAEDKLVTLPRKGTIVGPGSEQRAVSSTWSVVVPKMDYFYPELVDAIEKRAREEDVTVTVACSRDDAALERELVLRSIENGAQGVLIAPSSPIRRARDRESLEYLGELAVPVVVIDHWGTELPFSGVDCVLSDKFAGSYDAATHLIRHGYTQIAMTRTLTDGAASLEMAHRLRGYHAALADHGLEAPAIGPLYDPDVTERPDEVRRFVDAGVEAFMTNDGTACALLKALDRLGLAVPDDVALIGYDDEPFAQHANPPLTSVRVPKREIAYRAAALLRERIATGAKGDYRTLFFKPTVVARQSCGRNCPLAQETPGSGEPTEQD